MSWSINEVARMTGLTSRTLRHYDAIGLLSPAWTGDGGRRYYREPELLRLQEILLLRSLGLRLDRIADVLANRSDAERIEVLSRHRRRLEQEHERLGRLIGTVGRTIDTLKEQNAVKPDELFDGLVRDPYEAEARKLYGDAAVDEARKRISRLGPAEREALTSGRAFQEVHARLAELKARNLPVDDPSVQAVIARHYEIISWSWAPDATSYAGLGQTYLNHDGFRRNIGQGDDALVHYLVDAMKVYAAEML